jgi:Holliday junction resolvase RusA-like endonuclease
LEKTDIPSCNFLFKPGIRAGRYPYLYKNEKVEEFQKEVIRKLEEGACFLPIFSFDTDDIWLNVSFVFNFRKRFNVRDTSNMLKATEDALVRYLRIDDSRHLSVCSKKQKIEGDGEFIDISIEVLGNKLCKCGCGELTPIASHTRKDRGYTKGQPLEYVPGHNSKRYGRHAVLD